MKQRFSKANICKAARQTVAARFRFRYSTVAETAYPSRTRMMNRLFSEIRRRIELASIYSFHIRPAKAARAWQLKRLTALLAHAEAHVPLYRESFKNAG